LCAAVRFIVLSAKLSPACDKGEGSRYVHWKIIHSRWTVVLPVERSVLRWALSEILGKRTFTNMKKYILIYFEFCIVLCPVCCILEWINASPVAKETRLYFPLFKSQHCSRQTQNMPNYKLLTYSTRETNTSILFRKVKKCMNSLGIR